MFNFETCENVPARGGRGGGWDGGGLVELEGRVVWGGGRGVYSLKEKDKWKRWTDNVAVGATLCVCGGRLVAMGGRKGVVCGVRR